MEFSHIESADIPCLLVDSLVCKALFAVVKPVGIVAGGMWAGEVRRTIGETD